VCGGGGSPARRKLVDLLRRDRARELAERRFVILPLIDLYGEDLVVAGATLAALRERVRDQVADAIRTTW
jgi:hypothetical protein